MAILTIHRAFAEAPVPPPQGDAGVSVSRMFVDPSATSVSLGKAKLIVSPLTYKEGTYTGDYQIEVTPYFFKSQKGPLVLQAPEDTMRKLLKGIPIEFTGKATNGSDGSVKVVKGKATPSNSEGGTVKFSIVTDNGEMVFDTAYHFEK